MNYSVTNHGTHKKVFFYNLNTYLLLANEVEVTIELCAKLEVALKVMAK